MIVDVWAWDRECIRKYRDKHEPPDEHESLMLRVFSSNPHMLNIWRNQGGVKQTDLPSGLTVLTRTHDGQWEQIALTDKGEVLNYTHEPKVEPRQKLILTPEKIELLNEKMKFLNKKWKNPQAREQRRKELFGEG